MTAQRRSGDGKLSVCVASFCYLLRRRLLEIVMVGAWVGLLVFLVWTLASQHNPAFSMRTVRDEAVPRRPGPPAVRAVYPLPFRSGKLKGAVAEQKGAYAVLNGTKGRDGATAAARGKHQAALRGKGTTAAPSRARAEAKAAAAVAGGGDVLRDVKPPKSHNTTKGRKQVVEPKRRNVQSNPARPHRGKRIIVA